MQFLFSFSKVPAGSNVILYGMGETGRGYLRQLWATKWCSVIFAMNKNYWKDIRYGDVEICPPEALRQTKDTPVIVAVSNLSFQCKGENFQAVRKALVKGYAQSL